MQGSLIFWCSIIHIYSIPYTYIIYYKKNKTIKFFLICRKRDDYLWKRISLIAKINNQRCQPDWCSSTISRSRLLGFHVRSFSTSSSAWLLENGSSGRRHLSAGSLACACFDRHKYATRVYLHRTPGAHEYVNVNKQSEKATRRFACMHRLPLPLVAFCPAGSRSRGAREPP